MWRIKPRALCMVSTFRKAVFLVSVKGGFAIQLFEFIRILGTDA